jgi:hypothetical protein
MTIASSTNTPACTFLPAIVIEHLSGITTSADGMSPKATAYGVQKFAVVAIAVVLLVV